MFNNGYNSYYPYQATRQSLFSNLKGKFNWSSLLNNTQKTLNIINQAIPVFYQIKPIWSNAKTVFKIMGALKEEDKQKQSTIKNSYNSTSNNYNYNNNRNTTTINQENENTPNVSL